MGKRELLIVIAFVMASVAAYWLTARPRSQPVSGHSLPALVEEWRTAGARSAARGAVQTIGTAPIAQHVVEVRFSGFTRLHVIGEDRRDMAWTFDVEATGPSVEAARGTASAVALVPDDLGDVIALSAPTPAGARLSTALAVRVPRRLATRVEGAQRVDISEVRSVRLDNVLGDVSVRSIAGTLTGTQRNGALEAADVLSVHLTLVGVRTTLANIRGDVTVTARNGECRITAPQGPVVIDATGETVAISQAADSVQVNITGGSLEIDRPGDAVRIDGRRTKVEIVLDAAVPTTVVGTDAAVAVRWRDQLPITIDATATAGAIQASDFGLTPEPLNPGARLRHVFGTTARVSIRTTRGDIVIARRK